LSSKEDPTDVDVRRAAMDLLARREHSRLELSQKLGRRFPHQRELLEDEISILETEGLQSDARLAEAFVRVRTSRGQGPVKIRMELRGKGVPDETISLALEQCGIDWFELVSEVALKKYGDHFRQENVSQRASLKTKAKVSRFLQQRGFSFEHISSLY
jgi:regulatory protein